MEHAMVVLDSFPTAKECKVLDHCLHLAQDLLPLLFLGTLFCVMLNINGIQIPVIRIYM